PNTGLLTGFPNTIGQFVVGICLEEYRNDELISTTRRDFQYNVGLCGETVSSFFSPEVVCDETLTVTLDNQSENADQFEWYFNDPVHPDSISTDISPSYSYSDTGFYTIMLIAEPQNQCVDTFMQTIEMRFPSLTANFDLDIESCSDVLTISATDLSFDTAGAPVEWFWSLALDGVIFANSTEQNPTFELTESGLVTVRLEVESSNGCGQVIERVFAANLIEEVLEAEELIICPGDQVQLNPIANPDYVYQWMPPEGLDFPDRPNPLASPTTTTTYSVLIADSVGLCEVERSVTVVVQEAITLTMPADTIICSRQFLLEAQSPQATSYLWATDPDYINV
ncbi:MAG: hypothetical protein AAGD05_19825, partial [Bacteroidota bacterium]